MSKFQVDKSVAENVDFHYRGFDFILKTMPDISGFHKKAAERMVELGVKGGSKNPDEEELNLLSKAGGIAMVDTMVVTIKPCMINGEVFDFNAESDMDIYRTQGEELLAENKVLQNAVYNHCMTKALPDYEVEALGES